MAFDSNGNWSSDFYPITDRDNSVPILASKFQTLIQSNLKQSFENCILRDGTGKPTANISFNGHKITSLGNGTNSTDAVNKSQLDAAVAVSATEEQQGTVELSTEAEALAGTDDTTAMTPAKVKAVFDTLTTTTRFCANSGPVIGLNIPSVVGASGGSVTFSMSAENPLVCTSAGGTSFSITSLASIDVSGYADGTYNVFVNAEGAVYLYPNTIYRQAAQPSSMNTNDIWLNTQEPFKSYIKTADGLSETGLVPLPQVVVISSGSATVSVISRYNDNFVNNDINSLFESLTYLIAPIYSGGTSLTSGTTYTSDRPGWLFITGTSGSRKVVIDGNERTIAPGGLATILIPKGVTYKVEFSSGDVAQFVRCIGAGSGVN